MARGDLCDALLLRLRHEGAKGSPRRGLRASRIGQRKAVARTFRYLGGGQFTGLPSRGAVARCPGREYRAGRGSGRYRLVGMRTLLSGVPVRRVGRKIARAGDRLGDDRSGRRGLSKRRPGMGDGEGARGSLVLVGCGKMGSAMLRGWLAGNAASRFLVIEPEGVSLGLGSASLVEWHTAADTLPGELVPDAVVFAVKPQVVDAVLPLYQRWVRPETVFVSIVAGKTLAGLSRHLGAAALVRTMPNTPAAIGRAITVACANRLVTQQKRRLCDRLLAAIGEAAWVEDEALLDAVTAVSGSGPAYVFLLIEVLARAGEAEGLPPDLALRLARSTVAGSAELARARELSSHEAREKAPWRGRVPETGAAELQIPGRRAMLIGLSMRRSPG